MGTTEIEASAEGALEPNKTYRVKTLEVENFQGLRYAFLDLEDEITIVGGANESGKTSLLNALGLLVSKDQEKPACPVRKGAREAKLKATLGNGEETEIVIEIDYDSKGEHFRLLGANGKPFNGGRTPKAFLKELLTQISFNPLAFYQLDHDKQDAILRDLDPSTTEKIKDLDVREQEIYAERTDVNREVKSLKARYEAAPRHPDAPEDETKVEELAREHDRRTKAAAARTVEQARLQVADENATKALTDAEDGVRQCELDIDDLENQLRSKRADLVTKKGAQDLAVVQAVAAHKALEEYTVAPTEADDPEETRQKLATVEASNKQVRENAARETLRVQLRQAETDSKDKDDAIEEIKKQRAKLLEGAKYPIQGLGFDSLGVTFDGLPIKQMSTARQIEISCAIGMALNPKLRILIIQDGASIGTGVLETIKTFARENKYQILMEKFTESGEGCNIVLDNGRVRAKAAE